MLESNDIKRRLLSEVVQDNIVIMTPGQTLSDKNLRPAPAVVPVRRRRAQGWGVVFVVMLMLCLSAYDTSTIPEYPQTEAAALFVSPPGPQSPTMLEEPGPPPQPTVFSAPQAFDLTVLPLTVRKIVLDPGHGGKDSGARTPAGLWEKDVTLDIGLRLRTLLEHAAFEVLMTRENDETVSLAQRTALANAQGADLFVSIHINAMEGRQVRGVETYYLGPTNDPLALQLAAHENQESGYSLADFRRLLDGIHLHVKREESRRFAEAANGALFASLQAVNPALSNRGVKTAPFVVLITTEMPAILAEVSCLSNEDEARLLATAQYRQEIAQALARGVRAYTDALHRSARKGN